MVQPTSNVFDSLVAPSGALEDTDQSVMKALVDLLAAQPGGTGLERLKKEFEKENLTSQIDSWIGGGTKMDISETQLKSLVKPQGLFTTEWLSFVRSSAGFSSDDEVLRRVARLLPALVESFTPRGEIPSGPVVRSGLESMRRQFKS